MNKDIKDPHIIFVFGSNLAGRHGAGAARHAVLYFDAEYGVGVGRTGRAFAIPTKDENLKIMSLPDIESYIRGFMRYAHEHQELTFLVTAVGCGLAGYKPWQIACTVHALPENCFISPRFSVGGL